MTKRKARVANDRKVAAASDRIDEFSQRGASFVKTLSFIDEGLWGFEVTDADGYVLAFFHLRRDEGSEN